MQTIDESIEYNAIQWDLNDSIDTIVIASSVFEVVVMSDYDLNRSV